MSENYDVIIIGAGSTGMPAGIFAAERGARVLQIEADKRIGGHAVLVVGADERGRHPATGGRRDR